MNIAQLKQHLNCRIASVVDKREADAMVRVILEDVVGVDSIKSALNPNYELEDATCSDAIKVADRVVKGEPLQYIIGSTMWHGLRLYVSPWVLIPRPETSMLVDIICDRIGNKRQELKILDIGTGSGAIAIALARNLAFSVVMAIDNSSNALKVAQHNCDNLNIRNVRLQKLDILNDSFPEGIFDLIVSNPPYVTENERATIDSRVLDYEPGSALFVPDDDPLLFYRAIAKKGFSHLDDNGILFFEINPRFADELTHMLKNEGYSSIEIIRDYRGKKRFAAAYKS